MENEDKRREMAEYSRPTFAVKHFSMEKINEDLKELYSSLLC